MNSDNFVKLEVQTAQGHTQNNLQDSDLTILQLHHFGPAQRKLAYEETM